MVGRGATVSMAGGAGRDCAAGHAAKAGTNTSGVRWAVAQGSVWAHRVVVPSPALDDDLGLPQGVEDLAIEKLVPQPRIERLDVPVLPRRARSDVGGLGADRRDPLL